MAGCPKPLLQNRIKNSQMYRMKKNYKSGALWQMNEVNVTSGWELSKINFIIIWRARLEERWIIIKFSTKHY